MRTRTSPWPATIVAGITAVLAVIGCNGGSAPSPTIGVRTPTKTTPPKSTKLLADWPGPSSALILSGQMEGYLEPCGCSEGQKGGLGRRYDLIEKLKAQGWQVGAVDLGSLIKDPNAARGGPEQTKVKFSVALRALTAMRYNAIALSVDDLKLGIAETLAQYLNLGDTTKILCANVRPKEDSGFQSAVVSELRTEVGSVKLGITAVIDPRMLLSLQDPDKEILEVKPPQDVLPDLLTGLERDTDFQILMVQGDPETAKRLAKAYPGFEIVLATSHFADPDAEPERLNNNKTWLISVGKKGTYVGVLGFYPGQSPPVRYQRVTLGKTYENAEPIRKLLDEDFQAELKNMGTVENFLRREYVSGAPGATFIGADACKNCHPVTFAKWSTTKHAHGYESLTANPKRDRRFDAECISCHTTGFEYKSGWVSEETTPNLKGNQCENCHGPGSKHAADPDNKEFRAFMARKAEDADRTRLCLQCHDEDNSPKFNFASYWAQVSHKGMDTYTSPEVHKGLDLEALRRSQASKSGE